MLYIKFFLPNSFIPRKYGLYRPIVYLRRNVARHIATISVIIKRVWIDILYVTLLYTYSKYLTLHMYVYMCVNKFHSNSSNVLSTVSSLQHFGSKWPRSDHSRRTCFPHSLRLNMQSGILDERAAEAGEMIL